MSDASTTEDGDVRVLICDDNVAMRELLAVIVDLEPGLCVVGAAGDGNEVVLEATRLQPDVILLDLAMPNRSGLEALPDLRSIVPDAKIIVLSGFATRAVGETVLSLGAARYLEKGSSPDTIVATIHGAVAGRSSALASATLQSSSQGEAS